MKHSTFLVAVITFATIALASSAHAGRLFGDITIGGKPVPPGLLVTLTPVSAKGEIAPIDSTTTDKVGSYKLMATKDGKHTLTVHHGGKSASLPVFAYAQATRYDLILEEKEDGLAVRRK
jgi:hypothetical protein